MDIIEYIRQVAIPKCKVHFAYIDVIQMIFDAEKNENLFSQIRISDTRQRASFLLPFKPKNNKAYEHCLDVIEYGIVYHRINEHNENHTERFNKLKKKLNSDEIQMVRSWWNS